MCDIKYAEVVDSVKNVESYREPIAWGICRNDMGLLDTKKVLQSTFVVTSFGLDSDIIKILTLASFNTDTGPTKFVDNDNELVVDIDTSFIETFLKSVASEDFEQGSIERDVVETIDNIKSIEKQITSTENEDIFGTGSYAYRFVAIYEDTIVESPEVAYLKLTLLSKRTVPLRSLVTDGIFGALTNVAWNFDGRPIELELLRLEGNALKLTGRYPNITHVDKFPRMLNHIVPDDTTRILDTSKVRHGAQLAAGTTVMPGASYVNFNAGTEGPVMVEGRISSSAIVGDGSDIGGGASILGVLSGTDGNPITIGEKCLLGSNSVCGITLGDGCIIDAGISILEGTKVYMDNMTRAILNSVNIDNSENGGDNFSSYVIKNGTPIVGDTDAGVIINAKYLSGFNGMHFRQNSLTGVITLIKSTRDIKLNSELH